MKASVFSSTEETKWAQGHIEETNNIQSVNLIVKEEQPYEWMGFGGCFNELGKIGLDGLPVEKASAVMDSLFGPDSDLQMEFCRLPIGASDYAAEWYSLNETKGDLAMEHFSIERDKQILIPYIKEALKRNPDIRFFASPWSPPTWMKHPPVYNFGTLIWTEKILTAYALYFVKFIEAYRNEGIKIHQLHVQNEICADQKFPSCVWTADQLAEFIKDYLSPAFKAHNIDTEIWLGTINAPETEECDFDYIAFKILSDENVRKHIKGVAYQWAGKNAVLRTHESFPDIQIIQSENECGDGGNTWPYAKYVYKLMRHYITSGVRAYVYWNMVLNSKNGASTWGWTQNAMITAENGQAVYNHEFYVMKHLSKYVHKGSRVLKTEGMFSSMAMAFVNEKGQYVVSVMNPIDKSFTLKLKINDRIYKTELAPDSIHTIVLGDEKS